MLYKSSLKENIQTQNLLETFASIILEECVMRSVPIIKEYVQWMENDYKQVNETPSIESFKDNIFPIFFPVGSHAIEYNKKRITKDLKPFTNNRDMYVRVEFFKKGEKQTSLGQYDNNKNISIFISRDDYEEVEGHIIEAYATEGFPIMLSKLLKIINKYKKTLVHELQHFYDDVRSQGKYVGSNYSNDSGSDNYWKSSVEVSARYTDTILQLKNGNVFYSTKWSEVLYAFKNLFRKWELLDKDVQERLIKRLSQEYQEVQKQTSEPLVDITRPVEKLQSQYNEKEVELKYDKRNGMIEIYRLKTASIKEDEEVLKQVIKLAETYRHYVGIYLDKNFINSIGQTSSLLKKYGFKPNYGNKTNYKFNTSKYYFIRQPKRK